METKLSPYKHIVRSQQFDKSFLEELFRITKHMKENESNVSDELKGKIETINGMVNPRTGSISYRAIFPNSSNLLRSGISGKVRFPSNETDAILVPQQATYEVQGKKFVYLVNKENKVEAREVTVNQSVNQDFIVKKGLAVGETFVVEGLMKLREGMEINPVSQKLAQVGAAYSNK